MSGLLVKAKLQSLKPVYLDALAQLQAKSGGTLLLQDHYNVSGSLEEFASKVRSEFREWQNDEQNYAYTYGYILGIFADKVLFYCSNYWSGGGVTYYTISFDSGTFAMVGVPEQCDVKLVMTALDMSDDDGAEEDLGQENPKMKQDAVTNDATPVVEAKPADLDVTTSTSTEETDANAGGAGITTPVDSALGAGGGHSGDGATASPAVGTTGEAGNEGDKTEAGTKQSADAPHDAAHLLQGSPLDLRNQHLSLIEQSEEVADASGNKHLHVKAIVTQADIINAMNQVYPRAVWDKNLKQMNDLAAAGKFIGKIEHPEVDQGLIDTAIRFEKFWFQGNALYADMVVVKTEDGRNLQALIEGGVQVDFSSRGYGSMKQGKKNGKDVQIVQPDFVCVAFDAVQHGASTGSTVVSTQLQSTTENGEKNKVNDEITQTDAQKSEAKATAILQAADVKTLRATLVDSAELSEIGKVALGKALDKANQTKAGVMDAHDLAIESLKQMFPAETPAEGTDDKKSSTYAPTFLVKQSQEELAPKTVGEMFDRMVEDLPDTWAGSPNTQSVPKSHEYLRSPKLSCKKLLTNIANATAQGFSGRNAAMGLLALEQGKVEIAGDILSQTAGHTTAAANVDNSGAPLSAPMIFPLVRRIFPMYVLNEIASIQPMDRPAGKIFYKDSYRYGDPSGSTEKRIDLNTSANPFNSSFADNSVEESAAAQIRLRLTGVDVTATTKKIMAGWSVEEMQDLRAYHGLDASQELMSDAAREVAMEWNKTVLDDMLAQATGSSLSYLKTAPSGFTQVEWDVYIWNYIQKLSNDIFAVRNGGITHLICGVDAALSVGKGMKFVSDVAMAEAANAEMYPGLTIFPIGVTPTGEKIRILKTNFWGTGTTNGSKILGLRKGADWSDTAYVFAPYADWTSPMLTNPSTFEQTQGIISRAAKKVVVPEAMGYITVGAGTGTAL